MRAILLASLAPVMALAAVPAFAQESSGDTDSQDFQVIGYVPPLCSVGAPDNSGGVFDVGLLIDTTTGFLRSDLSAPSKTLSGAFCSARSTIAIEATPMAAQGFAGTVPAGFSSAVDYLASASGWTETPASWNTAAASNAAAVQTRGGAFTGDITRGLVLCHRGRCHAPPRRGRPVPRRNYRHADRLGVIAMFRPAVLVLTAAAALSGLPLHAQEADGAQRADYQVVGQTPVVCTLTVGTNGSGELVNFRTDDRNVFQIDQMVSAASLSTRAASFALRLDGVCNSAHTVRLESRNNGLWQVSETPPQRPAGFGTAVPYELTARWNDRIFRLSADAGVRGFNRIAVPVEAPASGEMVLSFDISEGATNAAANAPLVAGAYSDTLTVILEPQQ